MVYGKALKYKRRRPCVSREENRALNTNRRPSWSAHSSSTVAAALNSDIPQGCFTNLEIFQWRESSNTTHTLFLPPGWAGHRCCYCWLLRLILFKIEKQISTRAQNGWWWTFVHAEEIGYQFTVNHWLWQTFHTLYGEDWGSSGALQIRSKKIPTTIIVNSHGQEFLPSNEYVPRKIPMPYCFPPFHC